MCATEAGVLVHVGFHKTGTSTLQRHVFPKFASLVTRLTDPDYRDAADLLTRAEDGHYEPERMRSVLAAHRAAARDLVVSDEGLSGSLFYDPAARDRTAARLHELIPDARILMCVRNQRSFLTASYSTFVKKGGYSSFSRLLDDRVPLQRVYLDHLHWDTLVATYQRLFGPQQVTVLPYELLADDPQCFLARIAAVVAPEAEIAPLDELGVRNPSLSAGWLELLRGTNRFLRRTHYNPRPLVAIEPQWRIRGMIERRDARFPIGSRGSVARSAEWRLEQLLPRYEAGNRRLEELTGLALARYGYPLPPGAGG